MSLAAWELFGRVEVLYTPQKAARRPKFKEGILRIGSGRAVLLDGGSREVDSETVTEALVQQLRQGSEVEFPGHLVQPQTTLCPEPCSLQFQSASAMNSSSSSLPPSRSVSMRTASSLQQAGLEVSKMNAEATCGQGNQSVAAPLGTKTPESVSTKHGLLEQESEIKVRRPFKRPRVASEATGGTAGASCTVLTGGGGSASSSSRTEVRRNRPDCEGPMANVKHGGASLPTPQRCDPSTDLWEQCVQEDMRKRQSNRPHIHTTVDLWDQCRTEDAELRQIFDVRTLAESKGEVLPAVPNELAAPQFLSKEDLPTPCRGAWSGIREAADLASGARVTPSVDVPTRQEEATDSEEELLLQAALPSNHPKPQVEESDSEEEEMLLQAALPSNHPKPHVEESDSEDNRPIATLAKEGGSAKGDDSNPSIIKPAKRRAQRTISKNGSRYQKSTSRSSRQPAPFGLMPIQFAQSYHKPPLSPIPHRFADRTKYMQHFIRELVYDVQAGLSDLAAAWRKAGGDARTLPPDISVVATHLLVGVNIAPSAPKAQHKESVQLAVDESCGTEAVLANTVMLMFGRRTVVTRGNTRLCARGDLWVLFPPGFEPVLLRALWKGVSPRGRLLCAPANEAAVHWIATRRSRRGLVMMTGLASGAFSAELEQADVLHACEASVQISDVKTTNGVVDEIGLLCSLLGATDAALSPSETPKHVPVATDAPELSSLTQEQVNVAQSVAAWAEKDSNPNAVLVRGVFGSGKSCTLAASIKLLDRLLTSRKDPRRILLVCQTNAAVDNVLKLLLSQHSWDDFARLGSFKTVHPSLLHRTVSLLSTRQASEKELSEALAHLAADVAAPLRQAIERGILPPKAASWRRRRLVAGTAAALSAAAHLGDLALHCPFVLMDEATQLTEPTAFFCLQKAAARRILLMGDPRQLPPRVRHQPLARSLFERLWDTGPAAIRAELSIQYRCHPLMAGLAGRLFYGGDIRSGVSAAERPSVLGPAAAPLIVLVSEGAESRAGQSYQHHMESRLCASWIHRVLHDAAGSLRATDFGVVCLYRPQALACASQLASMGWRDVEASTIDAFQGSERDVIILSCGRSSPLRTFRSNAAGPDAAQGSSSFGGGDAFAVCPRRLNVAFTRARRHLIVVGSEAFLRSHPYLSNVLEVAHSQSSIFTARDVVGP